MDLGFFKFKKKQMESRLGSCKDEKFKTGENCEISFGICQMISHALTICEVMIMISQ